MSPRQLFGFCIAASIFIHLCLVQVDWTPKQVTGSEQIVVPIDFDVAVSNHGESLALEQGIAESSSEKKVEEAARCLKRMAAKHFLDQVHEAVERRKFFFGKGDLSDLIGNALYTFHIRPDDTFTGITLKRSSGDPRLDETARRAIVAASGTIKRPLILRGQSFTLTIAVKYQFNM